MVPGLKEDQWPPDWRRANGPRTERGPMVPGLKEDQWPPDKHNYTWTVLQAASTTVCRING
jgi:hypothetical protein